MSKTRKDTLKQATHRVVLRVVQNEDKTYEIFRYGEHSRSHVARQWLDAVICGRYGFGGNELTTILRQLETYGEAELIR